MQYARVVRWQLVPVCVTLIVFAACTTKEPESERHSAEAEAKAKAEPGLPEAPVPPPVGSRVVLAKARTLATEPKPDADRVYSMAMHPRVAEVVGYVGEFIELRSIAVPANEVCGLGGTDRSFEVHFFATLDDLMPVLGKPKQVEFDDKTKLAFAPGVPIVGAGADARLHVGANVFEVPLAADEIARWFQPLPFEWPINRVLWQGGLPLHYGDHQIPDDADYLFEAPFANQSIEGGTLLSFTNACGQFTLRTDAEVDDPEHGLYVMKGPENAIPQMAREFDPDIVARNAGILGVLNQEYGGTFEVGDATAEVWGGLTGCSEASWTAPKGVTLLWPETRDPLESTVSGGTPAGVVIRETRLPNDAHEVDGKLVCFVAADTSVCIESSQLRRVEPDCGQGLGGLGRSSGEGFGGLGKRVPQVRLGRTEVSPGLDRDIVRRIVRAHVNEVRSCYTAGLTKAPELGGRVTIAFEIAASGKVSSSKVEEDALEPADGSVSACIAKTVERWAFPKPKGASSVSVVYPFDLAPG